MEKRPEVSNEMMMRHHWEMYMHYKVLSECYERIHHHYMTMAQYHYQMYLHHCSGAPMPSMPGMQCPPGNIGSMPMPGGNMPMPGGNMPMPGGNMPIPGGYMPMPGGNMPMPGGNMPMPGGNMPMPNRPNPRTLRTPLPEEETDD